MLFVLFGPYETTCLLEEMKEENRVILMLRMMMWQGRAGKSNGCAKAKGRRAREGRRANEGRRAGKTIEKTAVT